MSREARQATLDLQDRKSLFMTAKSIDVPQ
jgi:hypothetical protein